MFALKLVYRLALQCGVIHVEEIDKHHVPKRGPVILVCNHLSLSDPPIAMGAVPIGRMVTAMAMAELWDFRIWRLRALRWLLWLLGQVPVDRRNPRSGMIAIAQGVRILEYGGVFLIFPEGGCSDGELRTFKRGVAQLAFAVPTAAVVPMHISGSNQLKPKGKGSKLDRTARVRIAFGSPLYGADYANSDHEEVRFLRNLYDSVKSLAPASYYNNPEDAAPAA